MVSVIIVSYNTREITSKCLKHVLAGDATNLEVIVVDNNSADGSVSAIEKQFPGVKVIANNKNVGFGAANNQGMKKARGKYLVLLNSDAFVEPETIQKCVAFLDEHLDAGVVGCKLVYPDGGFQQSMGRFPTIWRVVSLMLFSKSDLHIKDREVYKKTSTIDWVTGSCMMVRREVFEKTDGFDERFFMYGEEVEWQKRIEDVGYRVYYFADTTAVHLGGASTKDKTRMFVGEMQGYKLWFDKYGHGWEKVVLPWILKCGCLLRVVAFSVVGKPEIAKMYVNVLASLTAR